MIRFDHVSKKYPGTTRPALNDISVEVLRGEFVFLVGASGSGKSSCLRLILKEEKPSSGGIYVLGQDLGSISNRKVPYFRRNIGVVFQDFRLLQNKNVFQNVAFSLQVIGKSRAFIQEAVPDVLGMVGLSGKEHRLPHELSGGEQQRVAIARAVVNKPQVLLADEPTGNLDPVTSAGIMAVLERINASGTTIVMATHEAGIVDQMQRRVIELVNGDIVRDERHGGYTTTIPVQSPTDAVPAAERALAAADALGASHPPAEEPVPVSVEEPDVEPVAEVTAWPAWAQTERAQTEGEQAQGEQAQGEQAQTEQAEGEQAQDEQAEAEQAHGEQAEAEQAQPDGPRPDEAQRDVRASPDVPVDTAPEAGIRLTEDADLIEQLALAERLGLRPANSVRDDDEQNVGPVQ